MMSVSAVEDDWGVWETVPSRAVAVPACSSASSGAVSSMSDSSSEPEPPDTLSPKSDSSSELETKSSSSDTEILSPLGDTAAGFCLSHSQNSARALAC